MTSPRLKYEGWLYWLAFLIALGFRLIQLGALPLTDSEAVHALQALQISRGENLLLGPQPAYILFTSVIFLVTESANFTARLLPALVGSAMVFLPQFFREKLHPRPALVLAFLFAFDPGLTALSRQSNGTILAVTFLLFTGAMWMHQRPIPAGIFTGLALLSGPSIWSGLLVLGLTWVFLKGMETKPGNSPVSDSQLSDPPAFTSQFLQHRPALISLLATLLLAGTLLFTAPNGLSAGLSSLPSYLSGWVTPSFTTPGRMLFTFLAYEPLGIFLAFFTIVRGLQTKSPRLILWMIWLAVSLLLAVFYRQPGELAWTIIPLLALAAQELSRSMDVHAEERAEIGIVSLVFSILVVYIWFNFANIALNPYSQPFSTPMPFFGRLMELPFGPRQAIIVGSSLILLVCIALVAFGWSPRTARLGTIWSLSLFLVIHAMGAAWGASGYRTPNGVELWKPDTPPLQVNLLMSTLEDISRFSRGHARSQPVTVMGINSPSLEWALRNHEVEIVSTLDPQVAPPIVITPLMDNLTLPSAYRGQSFVWRQPPSWNTIQNPDWLKWLVFRQLPRQEEQIILWARDDLFPDARENVQP
jgi:hypothetical protein